MVDADRYCMNMIIMIQLGIMNWTDPAGQRSSGAVYLMNTKNDTLQPDDTKISVSQMTPR